MATPTSQEILDNLVNSYNQIASTGIQSLSASQRTASMHRLRELRDEIEYWKAQVQMESNGACGNVVLVQFGEAQ